MNRILALDVGDKRIGLAVSDPLGLTAQGIESYTRVGDEKKDAQYIRDMAQKYAPCDIVCGLPRNMNGTYGPQSEKVKAFAQVVQEGFTGKFDFYDERLSTVAAERVLIEADMSRSKRRKVVDKVAAVVILQGYLEFNANRH